MMGFILVFLFVAWRETVYPGVEMNAGAMVSIIFAAVWASAELISRLNRK